MENITTTQKIEGYLESRIGGRSENQDYLSYSDTPFGLAVIVCDGMGGGPAGRIASEHATEAILSYLVSYEGKDVTKCELLENAILEANTILLNMEAEKPILKGMGTTVTALLIDQQSAALAHVGDSRIYQLRFGGKQYRTTDHSQVMERVAKGEITEEEARTDCYSNVITRALGIIDKVKVDTIELPYEKGDRFVLCTDGVWGSMPEKELIPLMVARRTPLPGVLEQLMIAVDDIGRDEGCHHDNFSVIIIETKENSKLEETMTKKTRNLIKVLSAVGCVSLILNIALLLFLFIGGKGDTPDVPITDSSKDSLAAEVSQLKDNLKDLQATYDMLSKQSEASVSEADLKQALKQFGSTPTSSDSIIAATRTAIHSTQTTNDTLRQQLQVLIQALDSLKSSKKTKLTEEEIQKVMKLALKAKTSLMEANKAALAENLQKEVIAKLNSKVGKQDIKGMSRSVHYNMLKGAVQKIRNKVSIN